MITYERLGLLRVAEFHFDEDHTAARADVVRELWRSAPVPDIEYKESHTLVLDLTNSSDTILANMRRNARYGIRRAEKDQFRYDFWPVCDNDAVARFCWFYDRFASSKGLVSANQQRLRALAELRLLDLSRVSDNAGKVLVWHAHFSAPHRARLIHSASVLGQTTDVSVRALIGRANCHHTWQDILRFQREGVRVYDFGGWYGGTDDLEKVGIDRFKESFGGTVIREFNSEGGVTVIGRLATGLKPIVLRFAGRLRGRAPVWKVQTQISWNDR